MLKDIEGLADIQLLVNSFYERVRKDETIGFLFNDVARVDWDKHLPVMYQFWQQVIFNEGSYKGNPISAHQRLHDQSPLTKAHFTRWQELFLETVDELFDGAHAALAKQRAASIATVMQIKLLHGGIGLNDGGGSK